MSEKKEKCVTESVRVSINAIPRVSAAAHLAWSLTGGTSYQATARPADAGVRPKGHPVRITLCCIKYMNNLLQRNIKNIFCQPNVSHQQQSP